MWEIISTSTGDILATVRTLPEAVAPVFRGGFFARNGSLFLLRDPRDGRVVPIKH